MERIFDTHAHYFDKKFEAVEGGADAILCDLFKNQNIAGIVNVGTNLQNAHEVIKQASRYEKMYAAVGIHPEDCHFITDPEAALAELSSLLTDKEKRKENKIVALGEIGLDYHWQSYDNGRIPMNKELQAFFFDEQMKLAEKLSLPVIIHDREAHGDCFETVLRYPGVRGVFHSFSGSVEMARELVRRGWYISFSGVVTFKNARRVAEVAASVPLDRLLVETDAPYLAPHPHRGRRNDSSLMRHTVKSLALLHGISAEDMAHRTAQNAARLFGLDLG